MYCLLLLNKSSVSLVSVDTWCFSKDMKKSFIVYCWSESSTYIIDNGFSVLFDVESFDYGYYDEGSEGLKVK